MITQLTGSYETWEWDGQDWLLRDSNGPSANVASGLSYDPQHGVTILFGDTEQPETWRWDGTTWLPLLGAADGPIPNSGGTHQLVYDSARRRHVWYGYSFETWELALYDCDAATEPAAAESVPSCPNCPPRKNRYFSFEPPIGPENAKTAIRVTLTDLPAAGQCPGMPQDFSSFEGQQMWVGDEVLSNGGQPMGFFALATAPVFRDWTTLPGGVVHVSDCNVVPCATYAIEAISEGAWEAGLTQNFSPSLVVATTAAWGDVVGLGGIVNALDVAATVACTKAASSAPPKSWCDIYGSLASGGGDGVLNVLDVAAAVNALKGFSLNVAGPSAPAACD
jgi:hypothetical protein